MKDINGRMERWEAFLENFRAGRHKSRDRPLKGQEGAETGEIEGKEEKAWKETI